MTYYVVEQSQRGVWTVWSAESKDELTDKVAEAASKSDATILNFGDAVDYLGRQARECHVFTTPQAIGAYADGYFAGCSAHAALRRELQAWEDLDEHGLTPDARELAMALWAEQGVETPDASGLGDWLLNRTYSPDLLVRAANGNADALAGVRREAGLPVFA